MIAINIIIILVVAEKIRPTKEIVVAKTRIKFNVND
jgi:hypothetical protein